MKSQRITRVIIIHPEVDVNVCAEFHRVKCVFLRV